MLMAALWAFMPLKSWTHSWPENGPNNEASKINWLSRAGEIIRASSSSFSGYRRKNYAPMEYYDFMFWRPPSMNI
jgi:heme A synthase